MPVLDYPIAATEWARGVERNGLCAPRRNGPVENTNHAGSWEPTIQKIAEYQDLGDDWDGLGAKAPTRELLHSAIGLAYALFEKGVDPPHCVVPGLDGSVNFEWQYPDGTMMEVEIDRPLHADVMLIEPDQEPKFWTLPSE
ncbi:MAG: hypothetical protein HY040_27370 [Planctomycetes bacterium]|nr:hypothetical protein [Planctomycetota bacterium]